jgi:hypothetical protein
MAEGEEEEEEEIQSLEELRDNLAEYVTQRSAVRTPLKNEPTKRITFQNETWNVP